MRIKIDLRHSVFRQKDKIVAVYCANKKEYIKLLKILQGKILWHGSSKQLLELNNYEEHFNGIYIVFRPIRNYGNISMPKYSLKLLFNENATEEYNIYPLQNFLKMFEVKV